MTKFEHVTSEQVFQDILDNRDEWLEFRNREHPQRKNDPTFLEYLYLCGHWLGLKLKEAELDNDSAYKVCFAFGQRAAVSDNFTETTAESWNRWVDGEVDEPGLELAINLVAGQR